MRLTGELTSAWLMYCKGALFLGLGVLAGGLVWAQAPTGRTAVLLGVTVWAFCRFYYFLFHVLERYLGRKDRYAGLIDLLRSSLFGARRASSWE
jgi:hypothetical protein